MRECVGLPSGSSPGIAVMEERSGEDGQQPWIHGILRGPLAQFAPLEVRDYLPPALLFNPKKSLCLFLLSPSFNPIVY